MQTETITATEAWEAVERLKLDVSHDRSKGGVFVTIYEPIVDVAKGDTPVEAVASLLTRIGEKATAQAG